MTEKAILAIEEALLASLFTQRALVKLLIKNGIIKREDLEKELLSAETETKGVGKSARHLYLEKRGRKERRQKQAKMKKDIRTGIDRRGLI